MSALYITGEQGDTPVELVNESRFDTLTCHIADLDWQQSRVYFLAFLNRQGDNRSLPLPPGWPVTVTIDEPATELD